MPCDARSAARALAGASRGTRTRSRIAVRGEPLERRAAGVAEPEHARALVERLAGGVVERAAEHLEAVVLA